MADDLNLPDDGNPFNSKPGEDETQLNYTPARAAQPAALVEPPLDKSNPFNDTDVDIAPDSTALGAFGRAAAEGVAPAVGSLAAAGAGAELGAGTGAVFGPLGAAAGGLIGGVAGGIGGGAAVSAAQKYALSKLPDDWKDALGLDEALVQADAAQHGTASYLGGIAPYLMTMSPGGLAKTALPANATALQKLVASPLTSRLFGGAVMGGMELGNEAVEGEKPDWTNVAIATGLGMVFNRPNRIGETIEGSLARPIRALRSATAEAPATPTVAQAADAGVMGPGVTESTFMGSEEPNPSAVMTANENVRTEASALGTIPAQDLAIHDIARRIDPDTFTAYDALNQRRDALSDWLNELSSPSDQSIADAQSQRQILEDQLAGEKNKAEQRRLRAQIRDVQAQETALNERRSAYEAGEGLPDTEEMATVRQHLLATDVQMRDLAPDVAAAYRRAQDVIGSGEELPPIIGEPEADSVVPEQSMPPEAEPFGTPIDTPLRTVEDQKAYIASDVARQLVEAGRSPEEAEAGSQLWASRYVTRAARFEGKLGTAEDLYRQEAPTITALRETAREFAQPTNDGKTLNQRDKGRITFREGRRPVLKLMQDADASTFVHETGHQWLEELLRDADHPEAPDQLQQDAASAREFIGADETGPIKTRQHERFARAFEQYVREGVAPSRGLARVFAQFRNWLTTIYRSVSQLGKPINEDIRNVFDRLLAEEPERTIITPEHVRGPSLADVHEVDAREIEPLEADASGDRLNIEKAQYAENQSGRIDEKTVRDDAGREADHGSSGRGQVGGGDEAVESVSGGGGSSEEHVSFVSGGSDVEEKALAYQASLQAQTPESQGPVDSETGQGLPLLLAPLLPNGDDKLVDRAGNIRIENLTSSEDVARAIRDAAKENDDFIGDRRGVVTDGQVAILAEALGMDETALLKRRVGQAFNAEQVWAARKLLLDSATRVGEAMRRAATGTDEDVMAYAMAKDRHQMIQAQVAGITAEAGRALRAFRDMKGDQGAGAVNDFIKTATGKTLFQLKQEAQFGAKFDQPEDVSKFMADGTKRTFGRMILEYWINGLISGPWTHSTYAVGNTLLALEKAGPETAAAAIIGSVRRAMGRSGDAVRLGEVGAQFSAGLQSLPTAARAAVDAFMKGRTTLLPGEIQGNLTPFEGDTLSVVPSRMEDRLTTPAELGAHMFGTVRGIRDGIMAAGTLLGEGGVEGESGIGLKYSPLGQIPDITVKGVNVLPVGNVIRAPGRFVAAIHSFFRAMNYSMEKAAIAYREASEAGLTGTAFDARVADLRQNPPAEMMEQARNSATNLTLMGNGSEFTRQLSKLTNTPIFGFPFLKFIDPFVHIASNVMDQSLIQRTPLGLLTSELRADLMGKNGNIAQDTAMARMLVGTALSIGFGSLAAEGFVSGSGPSDPKQAAMWRLAGNQAHSVRIGDFWYQVNHLGPLGMLAGVAADMYGVAHLASKGDLINAGATLQHAFTQNILDESFMRGPANLIQAVEDPGRYGANYIRQFASSFVPFSVGMAQIARASDPYSRQARTTMDAIRAKIPGVSEELLPRRDIWGEALMNHDQFGPTSIYETQVSHDPVNLAMLNLGIAPAQLDRKIRNVPLDEQQYDDFQRIAGRQAKLRLNGIVRSQQFQNWPDYTKHTVIEEIIKQSRESARNMMMMKYPSIARQASDAKLAKLRGPVESIE